MSARAIWKGQLRLSLVTLPIQVFPATNPAAVVRFHELHRKCQTRLQHRKWCPTCEVEVPNDQVIKGYEVERGKYVALEEADIDKIRPEVTHVVALSQFVTAGAVDPVLIDEPYYLAPDGKAAAEPFAVLRDALMGEAAIGTVAFHGRERVVAVEPRGQALMMLTLRHPDEIRAVEEIPDLRFVPRKGAAREIAMAKKVMDGLRTSVDLSKFHDTYEEALRKMIKAKVAGKEIISAEAPEAPKVVNLMAALRSSLAQAGGAKAGRGRAGARKPPRGRRKTTAQVAQFPLRGRA
jgi:DNA end-binding protein Ku